MFDLLAAVGDVLRRTGILRPAAVALAGTLGIQAARHNTAHAPLVIGIALAAAVAAAVLRERGAAVAALGVASCAAFATADGLGPLLVASGTVIAARPWSIDRRLLPWPEVVDALVAVAGLAGLAGIVATEPSERAGVIAATTVMVLAGSWWRGPRHREVGVIRPTVVAYAAAVAAIPLVLAPDRLSFLGALPTSTRTAGRGMAAALAIFVVVCLIEAIRGFRAAAAVPASMKGPGQNSPPR